MELIRMRKSFALLLLMCGITLASCGGEKQDLETLRRVDYSAIDADIKSNLHIDFTDKENSKKLYTETRDSESYYDIYVANDYKSSLFTYEMSLRNANNELIITERTKELYANTLSFNVPTYQDELASIMTEAYNDKYGIPSLKFDFEISKDYGYQKKAYSLDDGFLYPAAKEHEDLRLQIVYMPVYATRTYKKSEIYKNYFFLPLRYSFVTDTKQIKPNSENENKYELVDKEITKLPLSTLLFDSKDATKLLTTATPVEENK